VASNVVQFADLDRALEWAEEAILQDMPAGEMAEDEGLLGELADGLSRGGREALEARLQPVQVPARSQLFEVGDTGSDLWVVRSGRVTLVTAWPPAQGLRLATIGRGMAFGEMAFLSREPRTACAGTEGTDADVLRLSRDAFEGWAREHPQDGLRLMGNLAQIGTRRLAATTRQLRSVLE
jgi:CRP-like cAMP-binding protein